MLFIVVIKSILLTLCALQYIWSAGLYLGCNITYILSKKEWYVCFNMFSQHLLTNLYLLQSLIKKKSVDQSCSQLSHRKGTERNLSLQYQFNFDSLWIHSSNTFHFYSGVCIDEVCIHSILDTHSASSRCGSWENRMIHMDYVEVSIQHVCAAVVNQRFQIYRDIIEFS